MCPPVATSRACIVALCTLPQRDAPLKRRNVPAGPQSVFKAFGKSKIFVERPVDPVESGCPDYFQWIKPEEARDLGTIRAQLKSRTHFPTPRAFADVRSNAAQVSCFACTQSL